MLSYSKNEQQHLYVSFECKIQLSCNIFAGLLSKTTYLWLWQVPPASQNVSSNGGRHLTAVSHVSGNTYHDSAPPVSSYASVEQCSQKCGSMPIVAQRRSLVEDRHGPAVYAEPLVSPRPVAGQLSVMLVFLCFIKHLCLKRPPSLFISWAHVSIAVSHIINDRLNVLSMISCFLSL